MNRTLAKRIRTLALGCAAAVLLVAIAKVLIWHENSPGNGFLGARESVAWSTSEQGLVRVLFELVGEIPQEGALDSEEILRLLEEKFAASGEELPCAPVTLELRDGTIRVHSRATPDQPWYDPTNGTLSAGGMAHDLPTPGNQLNRQDLYRWLNGIGAFRDPEARSHH